jgi:glycosyltransferase involved in cell wall biosynthesis
VLAQDYPAGRMEVLVVDGRSTDRTRAIVAELAAIAPRSRVQLLDNPHRIASTALNIGIRAARGEIIARVDGHTILAPDYLRRCVETLVVTGADNVGGLMRPQGHGYAGTCIALATRSRLGIGNSRFHYDERGGEAETVYLGCFRRSIFERVGLFDEGLVRNQDDELNDRIVAAGGRIWLSPHIRSTYVGRSSFRALWRQYYQYGYWKVRVLRRHPGARRLRHLAPAALVASLSSSALIDLTTRMLTRVRTVPRPMRRRARPVGVLAWGLYGAASLLAAMSVAARAGWRYLPGLLVAFWCLHTGYGTGFLAGVLRAPGRRDRLRIPRLEPQD